MTVARLGDVFLAAAQAGPKRTALEVDGVQYTYAELERRAKGLAATLVARRGADDVPLTAVLGQRSLSAFTGILGVLCSGHGYVPVLPTFPPSRIALMLRRSECRAVIVDGAGAEVLDRVLESIEHALTLILPDGVHEQLRTAWPEHTFVGPDDLATARDWSAPSVEHDDIAYLLFTSGSTGQPKGVMVSHRNILRFLEVVVERYTLVADDRFSHLFDLTFDLSLFDLFAAWKVGGCLCCPDAKQRLLPASYVNASNLSVWFSVPSTALLMKKTRTLTPGAFPGLRVSLFCGEALPVDVAEAWAEAASTSIVENIYGPTELTLACTAYRVGPNMSKQAEEGMVPIGAPFPEMTAKVVDPSLEQVEPGDTGELIMAGPQLTLGYWRDAERTAAAYVVPRGETETFYRTGDRVRRPLGDGPLVYLGRLDQQIKIRGYRVELGEIEAVIRREAGVDAAIAVGWPRTAGGADGVVAFIDEAGIDTAELLERMKAHLPSYMIPKQVRVVDRFPLNPNGKIDRKALLALLG